MHSFRVESQDPVVGKKDYAQPTWGLVIQSLLPSDGGNFLNNEGTMFLLGKPEFLQVHEAINVGIDEKHLFGGSVAQVLHE